ncbi:MAG: hypothetical protein ACOCVF_03420 [bacterium]
MKTIDIKINKEKYKIKLSNRAIIRFEDLKQKSFANITDRLDDIYTLMYSCLVVNNENFNYGYLNFLDIMDDNIQELTKFVEYFENMSGNNDETENKKKVDKILSQIMK